jgi:hypothetical protein
VTTCSLDDPAGITPNDHVFASRMLPWAELRDALRASRPREER